MAGTRNQLRISGLKQKNGASTLKFLPDTTNTRRSFDLDFLRGLFVLGILIFHIVPDALVGLGQGSMEGFFV